MSTIFLIINIILALLGILWGVPFFVGMGWQAGKNVANRFEAKEMQYRAEKNQDSGVDNV